MNYIIYMGHCSASESVVYHLTGLASRGVEILSGCFRDPIAIYIFEPVAGASSHIYTATDNTVLNIPTVLKSRINSAYVHLSHIYA